MSEVDLKSEVGSRDPMGSPSYFVKKMQFLYVYVNKLHFFHKIPITVLETVEDKNDKYILNMHWFLYLII